MGPEGCCQERTVERTIARKRGVGAEGRRQERIVGRIVERTVARRRGHVRRDAVRKG